MSATRSGPASQRQEPLKRRTTSAVDAAYVSCRRLALQLHHDLPRESHSRSVLLSTPEASDCHAYSGMGLAYGLAQVLGQSVLLIDACPARPVLSDLLNAVETPGFSDLLTNPRLTIEEFALSTSQPNLAFLAAGKEPHTLAPAAAEGARLLRAAESLYDFVVLAGGSALNDSTPLALVPHVGCVLLLVVENRTRKKDLAAAQRSLAGFGPRKLGLVYTRYSRGG